MTPIIQPIEPLIFMITVAFTLLNALVDAEHLNKKQYIDDHTSRFFLRSCLGVMAGLINIKLGFGCAFIFYALFDQILNMLRKLPFWYIGNKSDIDKFFRKKKILYIIVKISSLILGCWLFFK